MNDPRDASPLLDTSLLLVEIADLLFVVAEAMFPAFQERTLERLGSSAEMARATITSPLQWRAYGLMTGHRTQSEVAAASGMDSGSLSRFIETTSQVELSDRRLGRASGDPAGAGAKGTQRVPVMENETRLLSEIASDTEQSPNCSPWPFPRASRRRSGQPSTARRNEQLTSLATAIARRGKSAEW